MNDIDLKAFAREHAKTLAQPMMELIGAVVEKAMVGVIEQAAQQVAVPQEPAAYIHKDQLAFLRTMHGDESAQARYANGFTSWLPDSVKAEFIPLYAAPVQPAAYVPLTDEWIGDSIPDDADERFADNPTEFIRNFVRVIEQATKARLCNV